MTTASDRLKTSGDQPPAASGRLATSSDGLPTSTGRLPNSAHTSRPWRIHEIAPEFRVEDVWSLPTPGGAGDFPLLVRQISTFDPARGSSVVRMLFDLRWKLGALLGWDRPTAGLGRRVPSLQDRLPDDLRGTAAELGSGSRELPFVPLYLTRDECALEIANQTVHGVLHLGWVPADGTGFRGQMAVLVNRNGLLGAAYMAAITPFRHLIVYPQMMRDIERRWRSATRRP